MGSPFPGMNPYLEAEPIWSDFHLTMTVALRAELNKVLPDRYLACADRYIWIHEPDSDARKRTRGPDDFIVELSAASNGGSATTIAAPTMIVLPAVRREGNPYLKIVDKIDRRVVTVLEILKPRQQESRGRS